MLHGLNFLFRNQLRQNGFAHRYGSCVKIRVCHGYLKAPDDCHQLIIDPVAAPVVQKIFQWASEGAGLNTITVRLNDAGYLPPSHYKNTQGIITHENLMGNGNWNTRTVARILHAQVYTGDLVQGRTKKIDHRQVETSEMEWTVVRGTHEPIISHELFETVQPNGDCQGNYRCGKSDPGAGQSPD